MRRIEHEEAISLRLPTHEHHDLPANKQVLDTLGNDPGVWFHFRWDELGAVGDNDLKLQALRNDQEFRNWSMHHHIIPGYRDGGLFLMRDLLN